MAVGVAVVGGVHLLRATSTPMALAGDVSAMSTTTTRPVGTTAPGTTAPGTTPTGAAPEGSTTTASPAPVPPAAAVPQPVRMAAATYTVRPGDTLFDIAVWFTLHGFDDLYQANKATIGANPDLIFPGQTITLSPAGVTMGH